MFFQNARKQEKKSRKNEIKNVCEFSLEELFFLIFAGTY
jgi:hypothetical protein